MKVAVVHRFNDIRIEDRPVPAPGPGEALVRTRASGICSGDVMPWYIEKKAPVVLGHEPAGVVVAVGDGVGSVKPGDRVFVHHHAPCLACSPCDRGDHVQCDTWRESRLDPGGISEYFRVPAVNLANDTLLLPDGMTFEEAVFVEPLACVLKGLGRIRHLKPDDTAVVLGLGVMGQLHVMALRALGLRRIIGVDRVSFRLNTALELGAETVVDFSREKTSEAVHRLTSGRMAELVVVGPASATAMSEGLGLVGPGGTVLLFSPASPGETLTIDPNSLYFRDVSLVPSYSCGPRDTRSALRMLSSGRIPVSRLITHRFAIEETGQAYRLMAEGGNCLKAVITFPWNESGP